MCFSLVHIKSAVGFTRERHSSKGFIVLLEISGSLGKTLEILDIGEGYGGEHMKIKCHGWVKFGKINGKF